ncbi:hypothetical protein [Motilibacter deserti]|uniref:Tetratricopeptide repeat protein n=1 Tax=Motilibacter deserti TaxID=2714956 RepID=A0ABX0GRR0_9ACTN|nr:hypothetical protein [Motilibacter deserti]NHC12374.1 hypothetical protein [Motilibacter deserti]
MDGARCLTCGATTGLPACGSCGLPAALPRPEPQAPVGTVVAVRRWGGGTAQGVVVHRDGGSLTVLTDDGESSHTERAVVPAGELGLAPTWTGPGALLHLAAEVESGRAALALPPSRLRCAALDRANAADGSSAGGATAGLAWDAAAVGDFEALEALALPEPLRGLLEVEAWLARSDINAAAAAVGDLPDGAYPGYVPRVARLVVRLPARTPYASGVARWLHSHAPDPVAVVAAAALNAGTALDEGVAEALRAVPGVTAGTASAYAELAAGAVPVLAAGQAPALARLAAATGRSFNPALLRLDDLPERTLDDLIDSGTLTERQLDALRGHPGLDAAYVTARLDPTRLSDAEVARLRFVDEGVRRGLSGGSRAGLAGRATHPYVIGAQHVGRFLAGDDAAEEHVVGLYGSGEAAALRIARRVVEEAPDGLPRDRQLRGRYVAAAALATLQRTGLEGVPDEGLGELQRRVVSVAALRRAQALVFDGDWGAASKAARTALRLVRDRPTRDEALSLLACAALHDGHPEPPGLLDEALAGSPPAALLVNAALLAERSRPDVAVAHLARVVDVATDPADRVAAAQRALGLWYRQREGLDLVALPPTLHGPLRRLATSDLPLEQLRALLDHLATLDRGWLSTPGALAGSPHRDSIEARYFAARAAGLSEALDTMARGLQEPGPPAWLQEERDAVVQSLCAAMSGDEPALWAGEAALTALDAGLPMSRDQRVMLTALGCRELALATLNMPDAGMARLADAQVDQLAWAARNAHRVSAHLRDRAHGVTRDSASKVQWTLVRGIAAEWREMSPRDPAFAARVEALRGELAKLVRWVDDDARRATDALLDLLG